MDGAIEQADDGALLEQWRAGDAAAGQMLVRRHMQVLYRFFRTKVDRDVDELIQQTWLALLEAKTPFRGESAFRTFLLGFARMKLLERFRAERRANDRFDAGSVSIADLGISPSRWVVDQEEHRLLLQALRRIPFDHQVALELYYFESLDSKQIAAVLGISPNTIRSRLNRARAALEAMLRTLEADGAAIESTAADLEGWARSLKAVVDAS
jgi:RNA polymerase sigma factor (sigma-70 family)